MTEQSGEPRDGDPLGNDVKMPDPVTVGRAMADIAERSQRVVNGFLQRQSDGAGGASSIDPFNVGSAFFEMTAKMMSDPAMVMQAQLSLWKDHMALWQRTTQRLMGQEADPVIAPDRGDRRFKDAAWDENTLFDYIKQS